MQPPLWYTTLYPGNVPWMGPQGSDGAMVPDDTIESALCHSVIPFGQQGLVAGNRILGYGTLVTRAPGTCCESDLTIRNQLRYDSPSQRKWIGSVWI